MISTSSMGLSQVTLQFALGRDIDGAAQDVQAAINAAGGSLPKNLPYPPTYSKVNPADTPIITLALTSTTTPVDKLSDLADTYLAQRLAEVSGVGPRRGGGRCQARRAHPGRPAPARELRAGPRGSAHRHRRRQRRHTQGLVQRTAEDLRHLRQRPDPLGRRLWRDRRRLPQRRPRPARRTWRISWTGSRTAGSPPGIRAGPPSSSTCSASPAPTSSRRSRASARSCPSCSAASPRG